MKHKTSADNVRFMRSQQATTRRVDLISTLGAIGKAKAYAAKAVKHGGASWRIDFKFVVDGFVPLLRPAVSRGYLCSLEAHEHWSHTLTPQEIVYYCLGKREVLSKPNACIGVWLDGSGLWHYDVNIVLTGREEALALARNQTQQAIWDIARNKEIPVGRA